MVPDLIWAPDFFGPQEIWAPKGWSPQNLLPPKYCHIMIFIRGPNFVGPKFVGAQISWGPNFSGTKKMRSGTISVIAEKCT